MRKAFDLVAGHEQFVTVIQLGLVSKFGVVRDESGNVGNGRIGSRNSEITWNFRYL